MMRKTIYTLAFALGFLQSCEKQTTWDIKNSERFMVADCIITNELKNQEVKLYYSSDSLNQKPKGISGAIIQLNDGNNQFDFFENIDAPGTYFSKEPFMASAGIRYCLTIEVNGIRDSAFAEMAAINPLEVAQIVASDSLFRYVYSESSSPSMMEVHYDWSSVPEYCSKYGSCEAAETFYTLTYIDINKIFAPDKLKIQFPRGTEIIRRKYSLSDEHQAFIRSLLLETEWRGGIFDSEQGNVHTNFSGNIRGWFGACMVLSDTVDFD
jgi:hypothetical protein